MSAPERIWIDAWGGNWSPQSGGTQEHEYVRADLVEAAVRRALEWAAADCAMNGYVSGFRDADMQTAHNVGVDTAVARIRAATPDQIAAIVRGE